MRLRADLHLHSTASDGYYTPSELVHMALDKGLHVIGLTDHDTTAGIAEAIKAAQGTALIVIPGVEISIDAAGDCEIHILGYCIDPSYPPLEETLTTLRRSRFERAGKMLELLGRSGCPLEWEQVLAFSGKGSVGRPHIAQAMVKAAYVDSVESAFRLYLGRGAPAYVPRLKLSSEEAIRLILESGGVPVLAHPSRCVEYIPRLVKAGLMGLEVYYTGYPEVEQRFLAGLATKHGLLVTGGSDFHGPGITNGQLGQPDVPWAAVEALLAQAACRV
jgi:predicted metal-dependent phosphoesterase TrpH